MDIELDSIRDSLLEDPDTTQLARYVQNIEVYRCPADRSSFRDRPRVRSMSMNCAVGTRWASAPANARGAYPVTGGWLTGSYDDNQDQWRTYGKLSTITAPGPANLWVLMDEHPDAINDPLMAVQCGNSAGKRIVDFPASYHNGACGISFADGHSEIKKWQGGRMKQGPINGQLNVPASDAGSEEDLWWLQQRTSALK
jgi:prepilin-type processing-associated H-X9-DG protein